MRSAAAAAFALTTLTSCAQVGGSAGNAASTAIPGRKGEHVGFDAESFWREPAGLAFDVAVLETGVDGGVAWQSMVYTSEIYHGEPMRTFAYYARPSPEGVYPAVLSVHGGGGGADLGRAKAFAEAGYACLSYDWHTCGDAPSAEWKPGDPPPSEPRTIYGNIRYDDWAGHFVAKGDDWKYSVLYRAIMAGRRALTWMSSRPEVDASRLVVEGHSWGGFLTQLLVGVDRRPRAAVSSAAAGAWISHYAAGTEGHVERLTPWEMFEWSRRYDPAAHADRITTPILIRLATADFFGSVDTLADYWPSITAPKSLELQASANHGFAEVEPRIAWFDHWLADGPAFPAITRFDLEQRPDGAWSVRMRAEGPAEVVKCVVAWTTATGPWNGRTWSQGLLRKSGDGWVGEMMPVAGGGPLRVFVSALDANGRVVSSIPSVREIPAAKTPLAEVVSAADVVVSRAVDGRPPSWERAREIGPIAPGPGSVGEQSAHVETLWDADALHVRVRVDDTTPWDTSLPRADFWEGDSVQLRLRTDPRHADANVPVREQRVIHLGFFPDPGTGRLKVHAVRRKDFAEEVADVSPVTGSVEVREGSGYAVTVRMPWSFVDPTFRPEPGRQFRFALMVNYGDILYAHRVGVVDFNRANDFGNPNAWGIAKLAER